MSLTHLTEDFLNPLWRALGHSYCRCYGEIAEENGINPDKQN